jgi:hypothetical protein
MEPATNEITVLLHRIRHRLGLAVTYATISWSALYENAGSRANFAAVLLDSGSAIPDAVDISDAATAWTFTVDGEPVYYATAHYCTCPDYELAGACLHIHTIELAREAIRLSDARNAGVSLFNPLRIAKSRKNRNAAEKLDDIRRHHQARAGKILDFLTRNEVSHD